MQSMVQQIILLPTLTMSSDNTLSLISLNVCGMRDYNKRKLLYNYFREQKADIILVQESHNCEEMTQNWETQFGGKIINSLGNTSVRGVAILITKHILKRIEIINIERDNDGRFLLITLKFEEQTYAIANLYGHNKDTSTFFKEVEQAITNVTADHIIIGGDLNLVLDSDKDSQNRGESHVKSREVLTNTIDKLNLNDIWRIMNPEIRKFTWYKLQPTPIFSRLDMFLVSTGLITSTQDVQITPRANTDHFGVKLTLRTDNYIRGPGIWRFNNTHLSNEIFVENMKNVIQTAIRNAIELNDIDKWEFIKTQIIAYARKFSKYQAKCK